MRNFCFESPSRLSQIAPKPFAWTNRSAAVNALFQVAFAADPEHIFEYDARQSGRARVKAVRRIDDRTDLALGRQFGKQIEHEAGAAGARVADKFGQSAACQGDPDGIEQNLFGMFLFLREVR